jgi:hypothetical protein
LTVNDLKRILESAPGEVEVLFINDEVGLAFDPEIKLTRVIFVRPGGWVEHEDGKPVLLIEC